MQKAVHLRTWAPSGFKRGDDEAEVDERLENHCGTPMPHGDQTPTEPGMSWVL